MNENIPFGNVSLMESKAFVIGAVYSIIKRNRSI